MVPAAAGARGQPGRGNGIAPYKGGLGVTKDSERTRTHGHHISHSGGCAGHRLPPCSTLTGRDGKGLSELKVYSHRPGEAAAR